MGDVDNAEVPNTTLSQLFHANQTGLGLKSEGSGFS